MRYTTVIDISEIPAIYRSHTARLVYLHLALRSGYHDTDRDIADISVRRLAAGVGITVSACRHAIKILERAKLIEKEAGVWRVVKWIAPEKITPRKDEERARRATEKAAVRVQEQQRMESEREKDRQRREALEQQHTSDFIIYYEGKLEEARNGDLEARDIVRRRRAMYEIHCAKTGHQPLTIE